MLKCKLCDSDAFIQDDDGTEIVYCPTCGAHPTLAAYKNFTYENNNQGNS